MSRTRKNTSEHFHGGDLADAVSRAGGDVSDWLDLSTGINPNAWPTSDISPNAWTRLPGRREHTALLEAATAYYAAPDVQCVIAGPGSQALIQSLPSCLPDQPVSILAPTYSGYAPAWQAAGRRVRHVSALSECDTSGITILVNPNNPDGRTIAKHDLVRLAEEAASAGGWLVVDEAFGDLDPSNSAAGLSDSHNLIVLRSFGKFFGLAGLRLGFAIAPRALVEKLSERLGPWAVSGPAIQIGAAALADTAWQEKQRELLRAAAGRLDALLAAHGLNVIGGTDLFRLVESAAAAELFSHLLQHQIYVRHFTDHESWLRFGLPGDAADWSRLESAMAEFRA